jgi:uncharacterized protein (TIGR02284 family)
MIISDILEKLTSLYNLDNDAIKSYDSALKKIDDKALSTNIELFRDDHVRHVDNLARIISALGGSLPTTPGDIRGLFLSGATTLLSMTSTEGALKGLQSGEKITNKSYEDAVEQDFPPDILSVLSRNYQDEKVHLDYVNKALASRSWDQRRAA